MAIDGERERESSSSDCDEDGEDGDDARVRREHMLELYGGDHPELKLAFEGWERAYASLGRRVRRGATVAGLVRREAWQLAGVGVVVECVVLATVAQAHLLTCESWRAWFGLSCLASVVVVVPLVHRVTAYWTVRARIRTLLLGMEVLARRIHGMQTLGPLEFTFDEKAEDEMMRELLKKTGVLSTILRMAAITIPVLAFVFLLMLGIQVRCEGSVAMPRRLQMLLQFSPASLTP